MLYYENKAKKKGFTHIIGIDEAGRGPLAGPVVAAAVCLKKIKFENKISDSKKLTFRQREKAFEEILLNAHTGVGIINESVIDTFNILKATHLAMTAAVFRLMQKLPLELKGKKDFSKSVYLIIDGNSFVSDLPYVYETIVGGDHLSLSIACASIIAKVTRDRILNVYDQIFPQYGFKKHKGYPTLAHRSALHKYGPSVIHRKTFNFSLK